MPRKPTLKRPPAAAGRKPEPARGKSSATPGRKPAARRQPAAAGRPPAAPLETGAARVRRILEILARTYPGATCALRHENAWQLLVATILSAQCTDQRVNLVTPGLFAKYPQPQDLAMLAPEAIEPEIRSTGFYRNKARAIAGAARQIVERHAGQVPRTMAALTALPGVARKTANVVLGTWFHEAVGVVVDTHVQRVTRRLGLTRELDPEKTEADLMRLLPRAEWISFAHRLIWHGRQLCTARAPRCKQCPLETLCRAPDKTWSSQPAARAKTAV